MIPPITVVGTAAAALGPLWPGGAQLLIRFTGPEAVVAAAGRALGRGDARGVGVRCRRVRPGW